MSSVKTVIQKTGLRELYFKQSRNDQNVSGHATVERRHARLLHVSALNERLCTTCDRSHTHLIVYVHVCGYYSRAATIIFGELQVRLLFEGSYYSGCGFYSNKYGRFSLLTYLPPRCFIAAHLYLIAPLDFVSSLDRCLTMLERLN